MDNKKLKKNAERDAENARRTARLYTPTGSSPSRQPTLGPPARRHASSTWRYHTCLYVSCFLTCAHVTFLSCQINGTDISIIEEAHIRPSCLLAYPRY